MIKHEVMNLDDNIQEIIVKTSKYEANILNVGAAIRDIKTPNKDGIFESIVLSYKDYKQYLNSEEHGALGQTIARNAGRIENAEFTLNSKKYLLDKNNGNHNLHSGGNNINKKSLPFEIINKEDGLVVSFKTSIRSSEDKFPGNLSLEIIYIFTSESFKIEYYASSDEDTICNITNHAYFNLSGDFKETILEHEIKNSFKSVKLVNDETIVNGSKSFEYFSSKEWTVIGDIIDNKLFEIGKGFDNPFELNNGSLELRSLKSGRKLRIKTSYPYAVLYSANYPMDAELVHTKDGIPRIALAIEPQYMPNDINVNNESSKTILRSNNKYFEWIEYSF